MPLLDAAVLASRDTVALLIAHDARVNAADNDGATPLTAAVAGAEWRDDLGVVEFLLDRGADANARDNAGRSALSQVRSRLREVHGVPFLAANGERLMMLADLLQQHGAEG
jgi:ankyrin repeat protein